MSPGGVGFGRPGLIGGTGLGTNPAPGGTRPPEEGQGSFAETLKAALTEVNSSLKGADEAAVRLASGEATNLHEVVLATERANLALQFTMAIRNKLLEAYNELMRMPV